MLIQITDENNYSQLTVSKKVCLCGGVLWGISLLCPAVQGMPGIACLGLSTMVAILAIGSPGSNQEMVYISQASLLLHIGAFYVYSQTLSDHRIRTSSYAILFSVYVLLVLFVLSRPYGGFENARIGFFLWLFSLMLIGLSPIIDHYYSSDLSEEEQETLGR